MISPLSSTVELMKLALFCDTIHSLSCHVAVGHMLACRCCRLSHSYRIRLNIIMIILVNERPII